MQLDGFVTRALELQAYCSPDHPVNIDHLGHVNTPRRSVGLCEPASPGVLTGRVNRAAIVARVRVEELCYTEEVTISRYSFGVTVGLTMVGLA